MLAYKRNTRYWFKPPLGCQINWNHPLARNLVACFLLNENCGGIVFDIVNRIILNSVNITFPNTRTFVHDPIWNGGLNFNINGAAYKIITPQVLRLSFPITIVWQGTTTDLALNNNGFYFGCSYSNSTLTPSIAYGIKTGDITSFKTYVGGTNDGSIDRLSPSNQIEGKFINEDGQIAARFKRNSIDVFKNGALISSTSVTLPSSPAYASDSTFGFGSIISSAPVNMHTRNILGLVYNIALSNANINWLSEEPYIYILPTMSRRYYFTGPSSSATIGIIESDFNAGMR